MSTELQSLQTILRELKELVGRRASGFLFIVTDDNRSASIRLRGGHIDEIGFKNRFNDEAVELLSQVTGARARFQPGATTPSKRPPLGDAALLWLLGGLQNQVPARTSNSPAVNHAGPTSSLRQRVEQIALTYLGPIAGLLCDEAFAGSNDLERAMQQIAANLPDPDEHGRFIADVRAAVKDV
jgi:hypothetical protein